MPIKKTQEEIDKLFLDNNCKCISIYKNSKVKISYICSCGNKSEIFLSNFISGNRCMECSGNKKFTQEYIEQYFKDNRCELLSIYKNKDSVLNYKCCCGNISKICFNSFKNGNRCKKCGIEKRSGDRHHNYNLDRKQIKDNKKYAKISRRLLEHTLNKSGKEKIYNTEKYLGYSQKDLMGHLQKDPLFNKWEKDSYNYHIDHIIPVSKFVKEGITDTKIINNLDNLQILSKKENLSKKDNCTEEDFQNYISKFNTTR